MAAMRCAAAASKLGNQMGGRAAVCRGRRLFVWL